MALRALYLCDPEKNHECPKINCMMNPNAALPCCYATSNPAAAALGQDGKPIELPLMEQIHYEIEHTCQVIQNHSSYCTNQNQKHSKYAVFALVSILLLFFFAEYFLI